MNQDFAAIFGFAPYTWQSRLYHDFFAAGILPDAVDVPTGLGKTAVMALWLLARLNGAPLPRRLVYVVDRRVVVDHATEVADHIATWAESHGHPLAVSTLRGQHRDNRMWLEDPAGLAIIVGTVDMIGSRLLFEGYGVGRGMRPFQAGLLGADSLMLLDEAHLCPPFHALLRSIHGDSTLHPCPGEARVTVPRLHVLPLSATLAIATNAFHLAPDEVASDSQPKAYARYCANKRLRLAEIPPERDLAAWLAESALALPPGRNLVYCDSRLVATKVTELLEKATAKSKTPVELFTGARRLYERERMAGRLAELGYFGSGAGGQASFLVATSAGEVGVDLDADHMACDLVAFERMAQRLGRVNRAGGEGRASEIHVGWQEPKPPKASGEEQQRRYGQLKQAIAARRDALEALPNLGGAIRDASPRAICALQQAERERVAAASTPEPKHPQLERAQVEAWAMTSLREHPGRPDPQPWLRGWEEKTDAEVEIIWRRWLPWRAGENPIPSEVEEFFAAAPPLAPEILRIEAWQAARWLKARAIVLHDGSQGDDPVAHGCLLLSSALELRDPGALTPAEIKSMDGDDLRAALLGGTVVVSAAMAGLDRHGLLSQNVDQPPPCWDNGWGEEELAAAGLKLVKDGEDLGEDWRPIGRFQWNDDTSMVIAARRSGKGALPGDAAVARKEQSLTEHQAWVMSEAGHLAHALKLNPDYSRMLELAAACHDLGKARKLWQDAMGAPVVGRPFAKTRGKGAPARLKIGGLTYRHEFGSLAEVEACNLNTPEWQALPAELRELALHLIASHHGHARPTIAPVDPDQPPSSGRQRECAERAMLRSARLQQQWGPWGLAWWEAVFRAADQSASRCLDAGTSVRAASQT